MKTIKNLSQILTLNSAFSKDGRNLIPEDCSIIANGAISFNENEILWVGESNNIPNEFLSANIINGEGYVLTPEIIDSHTHLVFAGNRADEYSMRLNGIEYQKIAEAGGGILASSSATNNCTFDELYEIGKKRIIEISQKGISTIEIKSGYGLTFDSEEKISRVIHKLKQNFSPKIQIINTYLAAHAIPNEFKNGKKYIDSVVIPLMEKLASEQIIDFVDIFHEKGYFSTTDTKYLFDRAIKFKLKTKMHADEFNDNNGTGLAIDYHSYSADHLLQISNENILKLSKSSTVATLLPGTSLFLGKPFARAREILNAGAKVAIASDFNPGSCHCDNLLLLASIAAPIYKMNQAELWTSITLNAAASLGLNQQGAIKKGMKPRFSTFKCNSISDITYNWGKNLHQKLPTPQENK